MREVSMSVASQRSLSVIVSAGAGWEKLKGKDGIEQEIPAKSIRLVSTEKGVVEELSRRTARRLPTRHLLQGDDFSSSRVIHHASGLLMESAGKFFGGENALRHKPRTDNVTLLDFDRMTAQGGTTRFVNLPNILQKARHYPPIQRPNDNQPTDFQSFDIEVSQSELMNHDRTPLRIAPRHLPEDCPGLVRNPQPGGRRMLTSSLVCPSNAFFIFMGDHGINAVP